MIFFLLAIFILLMFSINNKISFVELRKGSKKIKAEVVAYRKERNTSMRNDYTKLNYPYVRIEVGYQETIIVKLSYASNYEKPFKIGEKIEVFWSGDKLLYWDTYNRGFFKHFPERWGFYK